MRLIAIGLSVIVIVCGVVGILRARVSASDTDPWLHFRSQSEFLTPGWEEIPASRIHRISKGATAQALGMLAADEYVALPTEKAERLGVDAPLEAGLARYLVRAVKNSTPNGLYKVLTEGKAVVISHESLSKHTALDKDALVVDLPKPPTKLFVEVRIAE